MSKWIISFDKKENLLSKSLRKMSIGCAAWCLFMAILGNDEYNYWILPLTYSIGMILLGNRNVIQFTPGIITLNIVMFCRYSILPVLMCISSNGLFEFSKQYGHMHDAIIIMWIELLGLLCTIFFTGIKFRKRTKGILLSEDLFFFYEMKYGSIICISGIILVLGLAIKYPHLIGGIKLITQGYVENVVDLSEISGVVGIIWKSLTTWLSMYFLYLLKKKNFKGKILTVFLVFGIAVVVLISFIGQVTISRWYSFVTFCSIYFCVIKMFPEKKKNVTRLVIAPALLFLFVVSIYKNTGYLNKSDGMFDYIKELFDVSTMNSYFAGPVCVNNAIYLKEQVTVGISSLVYDLFRNFPVLNHFIDVSKSTVEMYSSYLGRGDQILPLVGQSMIYFGYIFTPFLSIISVMLIRYFDYRYINAKNLCMYIYSFIACWLGLVTILNFTICVSWFYSIIIPIFILLKITGVMGTIKVKEKTVLEA